MQKLLLFILFSGVAIKSLAQTLGGSSVYNFLRFSASPQLTSLGGINVSQQNPDISLTYHNPALLRSSMSTQTHVSFNSLGAGIRNYHLVTGYHAEKLATNFGLGINYFNYGSIQQTDASGNSLGNFRPADYVVQLSASRQYLDKWQYGASIKFIQSSYSNYRSSGIAMDIGLVYADTSRLLQVGLVLKNMGMQLKAYNGSDKDDLPFDIQLGISKKLAKAPLQFSLTLHHLHQFNIRYDDSSFNNNNGFGQVETKGVFDQLFRHIVFSTQIFIADKIEISAGYNYLRRKELNIGSTGNGLNGFSLGVGVLIKKLQLRYARTYYQANNVNNQFGLNFSLNSFSSFRKK